MRMPWGQLFHLGVYLWRVEKGDLLLPAENLDEGVLLRAVP